MNRVNRLSHLNCARLASSLALLVMSVLVLAMVISNVQAEVIRPKVRLQLHLAAEDVPELRQLLLRFGEDHGLRVVDVGAKMPVSRVMPPVKGRRPFIVELRRDDLVLRVDDFMEANKFFVGVYELKPTPEARQIASEFEGLLRNRWQDRLRPFTDP